MKKLISLLLCLVMILGVMTACGSSDKSSAEGGSGQTGIVGTWKANLKLAEYSDMGDMSGMMGGRQAGRTGTTGAAPAMPQGGMPQGGMPQGGMPGWQG